MKKNIIVTSMLLSMFTPMTVYAIDALTVDVMGRVGIGTASPSVGLHILRADAQGIIKVEETNPTTAKRFQVQLVNKGGTGFLFKDTSVAGREWQVATLSDGAYTTSYLGTGGPEFKVFTNGTVQMGPGSVTNFNLQPNGELYIGHGSVHATSFISTSSKSEKEDFSKLDSQEVVSKLENLEVTKWRYKDASVKGHHIGPMAEDFYKLFELGPDNKHVAAADLASVALIAAKELQKKAKLAKQEAVTLKKQNIALKNRLEAQAATLTAKNDKLQERLDSLEKLVTNLASSEQLLNTETETVALK